MYSLLIQRLMLRNASPYWFLLGINVEYRLNLIIRNYVKMDIHV